MTQAGPLFLIDGHLDLSMNALEWNRDFTQTIQTIRKREERFSDKPDRGRGTVCFPEMRRARIGLCVATQIARYVKPANPIPGWHSPEQAWAQTQGQLAWYQAMFETGEMCLLTQWKAIEDHVLSWKQTPLDALDRLPIGMILSLEGADSMVTLHHLERAYEYGLRALGPAHYGPGTYSPGTESQGSLSEKGRHLIQEMDRLHMILDATHLTDEAFWEAMDLFNGPVWASHNNCRALVPHQRQFSDEQLQALIQRGAVIGAAFDAWMLYPNWIRGKTTPQSSGVTLNTVVDHIDHICQLAGNTHHVGIGSDLDGGFGREQSPMDLDTIADLQNLIPLLTRRGYKQEDIQNLFHNNWLRFLKQALP